MHRIMLAQPPLERVRVVGAGWRRQFGEGVRVGDVTLFDQRP